MNEATEYCEPLETILETYHVFCGHKLIGFMNLLRSPTGDTTVI